MHRYCMIMFLQFMGGEPILALSKENIFFNKLYKLLQQH